MSSQTYYFRKKKNRKANDVDFGLYVELSGKLVMLNILSAILSQGENWQMIEPKGWILYILWRKRTLAFFFIST